MGDLKILSPMDAPPLWRKSEDKTDDDENIMDKDGDQGCISPPSVSGDYHSRFLLVILIYFVFGIFIKLIKRLNFEII